jgi:hypothetical protein
MQFRRPAGWGFTVDAVLHATEKPPHAAGIGPDAAGIAVERQGRH